MVYFDFVFQTERLEIPDALRIKQERKTMVQVKDKIYSEVQNRCSAFPSTTFRVRA